jgi:hypothetical protein
MKSHVPVGLTLAFALGSVVVAVLPLPVSAADKEDSAGEIEKLVRQLGDQSFDRREEASRQLRGREDAIPALRKAAKSGDAEVARRAAELLDLYARKDFERLKALAKDGRVDEAVENLVRRKKWDDERACWQVMAELAGVLCEREKKAFGWASVPDNGTNPGRDFRRFEAARPSRKPPWMISEVGSIPERREQTDGFLIRVEEMTTGRNMNWGDSFLAVRGEVRIDQFSCSTLFAGSSVRGKCAFASLIVCDGDCSLKDGAQDSLIIARGDVRLGGMVRFCHIVSGGKVHYDRPANVEKTEAKENEPNLLGFVKFFDPTKIGIKVESAEGVVRVKEAEKGKAFAAAGLRADDLISSLGGDAVKDADQFRRLLRAKLAVEGETTFKVRRGDKVLEVPVKHKD